MFKLIAIDVDGTLLNSAGRVSPATARAVKAARKAGARVVLATGRPAVGVARFLKELEILDDDDYVIGHNGALIEKARSREIVCYQPLSGGDFKALYETGAALGFETYAFGKEHCVATAQHGGALAEAAENGVGIELVNLGDVPEDRALAKVLFWGPPPFLDKNIGRIPADVLARYSTMRSAGDLFEFLRKGVDKGAGVAFLAERLGIPRDETMCIGDSGNDLRMIEYAGLGVAMGNGMVELKRASGFVTRTNDEDGVAHAIEKFVLK